MLKSIFFGNSDFSIPTLSMLHKHTHIEAIITGKDKEIVKRSRSIQKPLPKVYAEENNIPFFQPDNISDPNFISTLKAFNPDIMVIISYGKILPPKVFSIPKLGTFNLHASLLPLYRGASPLQEALLQNDSQTGITLQKINEKMDDGNIFWTRTIKLNSDILYPQLRKEMAQVAALTLNDFFDYFYTNSNTLPEEKKQLGEPSFCGKIKKEQGYIAFNTMTAQEIFNRYRAFYTWPEIYFSYKNHMIKIEKLSLWNHNTDIQLRPGTIIQADKQALVIQTLSGCLFLEKLKPANKKSQDYISFINGYQIKKGGYLC